MSASAWIPCSVRLNAFEAALAARLRRACRVDALGVWASSRLASGQSVGKVQVASGLAVATFIARYRAAVGMAPKRHADVLRLQAVLRAGSGPDALSWAALSADAGYADQAHLGRRFRALTGMTPGQYRRGTTGWTHHVAVD